MKTALVFANRGISPRHRFHRHGNEKHTDDTCYSRLTTRASFLTKLDETSSTLHVDSGTKSFAMSLFSLIFST